MFHIGMGALCTINSYAFIGWVYFIFLTHFIKYLILYRQGFKAPFIGLLIYIVSFELLTRLTQSYPFLPTESGKYFVLLFSTIAIVMNGISSVKGFLLVLLLIPAFILDESGQAPFILIIFNLFGPLAVALGVTAFHRISIWQTDMNNLLRMIWLTSISSVVFTFLKTPELDQIEFSLKANFSTTANLSSNQVSTVFGLGMFLTFYSIIKKLKFSGHYLLDLAILVLFVFQGLLTFSRGGMIVGAICMLMVFLFSNAGVGPVLINNQKKIWYGLLGIFSIVIITTTVNQITGGKLFLRYQGETEGTLRGSKELNLNQFTSGRADIFWADMELWLEYPILGVGGAASTFLRPIHAGVSPHVELSRLFAEHGILGLIYFLLLLSIYWSMRKNAPHNMDKGLFYAFFLMAFLTTFHAAMRTYVSTVFFILASIYVFPDDKLNQT